VRRQRPLHHLPHPGDEGSRADRSASDLEAEALVRIGASAGMRLACQIRPAADLSVMPLLAADAGAADGSVRGGLKAASG